MFISAFYVLYAIASVIFVYKLAKLSGMRELLLFSSILLLSVLLFHYENANLALLLSGMIIFSAIIPSYGTRLCYLFILIGAGYAVLAYTTGAVFVLQALFMGMLAGSQIVKEKKKYMHKGNELQRNAVQLIAGLFFIAVFILLRQDLADSVLFLFVILGSVLGNYSLLNSSGSLAKALRGLERHETVLGSGARWLALGSLAAAAFLPAEMVIIVFSAIFIADSFSTLVGLNLKTSRLPYNKNKSTGGTLAYFATVFLVSYLFIGLPALPLAVFAALFESQPFHIDDNFDVSLAMVILILLPYLGVVPKPF